MTSKTWETRKIQKRLGFMIPPLWICECDDPNCREILFGGQTFVYNHHQKGKNSSMKRPEVIAKRSGKYHPWFGKHLPESTRKKIGRKGEHRSPRTEIKQGQRISPSTEFKKGEVPSGKDSPFYGKPPSPKCNRAHGDWYDTPLQGTKFLRSQWEIKYAKDLDSKGIIWMYEMETFPILLNGKKRTYTPDFFLPQFEKFIDVKGNPKGNADKIQEFRDEYPWDLDVLLRQDLLKLGINLKTKEPKYVFKINNKKNY